MPASIRRRIGCIVLAFACLAAKPVLTASLNLVTPEPQFGQLVIFDADPLQLSGPPKSQPRIQVLCYQDVVLVYGAAGPADQSFLLGGASSLWHTSPGPAHCVATLYYWSYKGGTQQFVPLAATEFDAADPRV
jgi:hypothetical protein